MILRLSTITIFFLCTLCSVAQSDSIAEVQQEFEEFVYLPNFKSKYATALRRVKRVYPLALHAKKVVDSLNSELATIEKRRKKKKYAKTTHKALKADFKFLLKELYVSEGKVLAKLIYRETGLTIYDLIKTYKGVGEANLYAGIAQAFDQDLKSTYDPIYEDYVIERVIENIEAGIEPFDPTFQIVDKAHYKEDRAAYKQRIKENKKRRKAKEKEAKKKLKN
ncbi:MAG: DUF4294 domain-containing protein [Lishizhenia sp.]